MAHIILIRLTHPTTVNVSLHELADFALKFGNEGEEIKRHIFKYTQVYSLNQGKQRNPPIWEAELRITLGIGSRGKRIHCKT